MKIDTRILVLFAHPSVRKSRVNRELVAAIRGLEGVKVHDLYEAYPDHDIDVDREQALLLDHDLVVFQHPFYWYSTPSILKEWQDLVLKHGWAYGRDGHALRGKQLLTAVTAGAREESYLPDIHHHRTIRQLLAPISQTAWLCGMEYLPPFVVYGTHLLDSAAIDSHASDYRRSLIALRDGSFDLEASREWPRLNHDLGSVIRSS